jgi:hypothetical protein
VNKVSIQCCNVPTDIRLELTIVLVRILVDLSGVLNTSEEINTMRSLFSKILIIKSPRARINLLQQVFAWKVSSIRIQSILVTSQALIQKETITTTFVIHGQLSAVFIHIVMAKDALDTREIGDPAVSNRIVLLLGISEKTLDAHTVVFPPHLIHTSKCFSNLTCWSQSQILLCQKSLLNFQDCLLFSRQNSQLRS